jgi:hypothetical protein
MNQSATTLPARRIGAHGVLEGVSDLGTLFTKRRARAGPGSASRVEQLELTGISSPFDVADAIHSMP